MVWSHIENIVGETLPMCIKKILIGTGYDTILSLRNITLKTINHIESHVNNRNPDIVQEFDCCHEAFYKNLKPFKFLPGHCDMLLSLSNTLSNRENMCENSAETLKESGSINEALNFVQAVENNASLPVILKEMVKTALRNSRYNKHNAQYSDIIRYFATYIYIVGGKSCYEVLYNNLPLPSVSTVCKYFFLFLQCYFFKQLIINTFLSYDIFFC